MASWLVILSGPRLLDDDSEGAKQERSLRSHETEIILACTLDGVDISADGAAIEISGVGDVAIELDGDNTVQGGEGCAGMEKNNEGSINLQTVKSWESNVIAFVNSVESQLPNGEGTE